MPRALSLDAAAGGNQQLYQVLSDLQQSVADLQANTGATGTVATPDAGSLAVNGVDGHFKITITPSAQLLGLTSTQQNQQAGNTSATTDAQQLVHQLQSATDPKFDNTSNVTTYGPASDLVYDITDPNQTKYWRFRSSSDNGQSYNAWVYLSDPQICGVVPVWSGLLKNSSLAVNNAATTPSGGNPLTQHGTTTAIDAAASLWKMGDQVVNYSPGQVDPGSFGTYFVYAKDPKRTGGTVTFFASTNGADVTSDNSNIYFGKITTAGGGGGTGSGAGGGTCCRAGVTYRRFDGTNQDCSTLKVGDDLLAADGGREVIQSITLHPLRPCFHLEFDASGKLTKRVYIGDFTVYQVELDRSHTFIVGANGIIDGACSTHIIQYAGGGFTDVFGAVQDEVFNLINGGCGSHNFQKA